jgi:hypothetical protein
MSHPAALTFAYLVPAIVLPHPQLREGDLPDGMLSKPTLLLATQSPYLLDLLHGNHTRSGPCTPAHQLLHAHCAQFGGIKSTL